MRPGKDYMASKDDPKYVSYFLGSNFKICRDVSMKLDKVTYYLIFEPMFIIQRKIIV